VCKQESINTIGQRQVKQTHSKEFGLQQDIAKIAKPIDDSIGHNIVQVGVAWREEVSKHGCNL
jgi:hypothetical protein